MKYRKQKQGLEQRRAAYDALPAADKASRQRPGSLQAGGPKRPRQRKGRR